VQKIEDLSKYAMLYIKCNGSGDILAIMLAACVAVDAAKNET